MNLNKTIKEEVDAWLRESFVLNEADIKNDRFVNRASDKLGKAISQKFADNDPNLMQKADEIGINPNWNGKEYIQRRGEIFKGLHISPEVQDKINKVIDILSKATSNTGRIVGIERMVKNGETYGLSYNEIMRIKDFIDSEDLRYMYDKSIDPKTKQLFKFGNKLDDNGELDSSNFDLDNITTKDMNRWFSNNRQDKFTYEEGVIERKRGIVTRYLLSEYGTQFEIPSFPLGNAKVKDALLVNFTSAFRCPAWNECLVKHACYARSGEGRHYENSKINNDKKHLMWEAGHNDPQLMQMIHNLLKAYVVDYSKVSQELNGILNQIKANNNNQDFLTKIGSKNKIETLSEMNFSDLPTEVLDVFKNCVRVKDIRLNENGDFIGEWLLKAFDDIAGDFSLIGVNTAAYSCRNLNFENIKNIIINASRMEMEGPTIARYFYALPSKMYDALEDTYQGKSITDEFNAIGRTPLPLYSVDAMGKKVPNGNYYYKCPCGREDFAINGKKSSKINCYQCHLCYEKPDDVIKSKLQNGGKYFVFVKAHGTGANLLDSKREMEVIKTVGVSQNYNLGLTDDGSEYNNDEFAFYNDDTKFTENTANNKTLIKEDASNFANMENEAYNTIANNAITSMNEHLGGIALTEKNIKEQKQLFRENYQRFFKR